MPNDIKKLKRLMSANNYLRKENPVILKGVEIDPSQALKYAWWFESFRTKLSTGIYRFSYFKEDGTIREARGTLDLARLPEDKLPKTGLDPEAVEPVSTFRYYDLGAAGWRSFRLDRFIGFVEQIS